MLAYGREERARAHTSAGATSTTCHSLSETSRPNGSSPQGNGPKTRATKAEPTREVPAEPAANDVEQNEYHGDGHEVVAVEVLLEDEPKTERRSNEGEQGHRLEHEGTQPSHGQPRSHHGQDDGQLSGGGDAQWSFKMHGPEHGHSGPRSIARTEHRRVNHPLGVEGDQWEDNERRGADGRTSDLEAPLPRHDDQKGSQDQQRKLL